MTELEEDQVQTGSFSASTLDNEEETNSTRKANAAKVLNKFKIYLISDSKGIYYCEPTLSSNCIGHVVLRLRGL